MRTDQSIPCAWVHDFKASRWIILCGFKRKLRGKIQNEWTLLIVLQNTAILSVFQLCSIYLAPRTWEQSTNML